MSDSPPDATVTAETPVAPPSPQPVHQQQQFDDAVRCSPTTQHQNGGSPAAIAAASASPDTPRKKGTDIPRVLNLLAGGGFRILLRHPRGACERCTCVVDDIHYNISFENVKRRTEKYYYVIYTSYSVIIYNVLVTCPGLIDQITFDGLIQ